MVKAPGARPVITLVLITDGDVASAELAAVEQSDRVQVARAEDLGERAAAFALHTADATLAATHRDPIGTLVSLRTRGFTGPLLLAIDGRYASHAAALKKAGVLGSTALPVTERELTRLLTLATAASPQHRPLRGGLILDAVEHTVWHGDRSVRLSQREFTLLQCLWIAAGKPVSVAEILRYVWVNEPPSQGGREIVDVYVSQLRRKLKTIGVQKDAIKTYRRFGYGLAGATR